MTNLEAETWTNPAAGLITLVGQLEERLDTLSKALAEVRSAVQMLALEASSFDAYQVQAHAAAIDASVAPPQPPSAEEPRAPIPLRPEVKPPARYEADAAWTTTPSSNAFPTGAAATSSTDNAAGDGGTADEAAETQEQPLDPDSVRDEVRRAVEQARAELAAGTLGRFDAPVRLESEPAGAMAAPPVSLPPRTLAALSSEREERSGGTPSIVIEDAEGRVDLARVYDTLSRVNAADQAVLLNYTPHSVTVGVGMRLLPDAKALESAATAVFGRPCSVSGEGVRLAVRISGRQERLIPSR